LERCAFRQKQLWIGVALAVLSASVLVCAYSWMSSRTFVALKMPVSLARGSSESEPFEINLKNYYSIELDTGWRSYFDPKCLPYDNVKARWILYKDGAFLANWDQSSPYTDLDGFQADKGWYRIQLDILSDTGCLNPGHPNLLIYTDRTEYANRTFPVFLLSALGMALGISLVILAFIPAESNDRITDSHNGACFQYAQKLHLGRQFESPPAFALIAAPFLMILVFVLMILSQPYPQRGLYVHLLDPKHPAGKNDPLTEPVITCVADEGPGSIPKVYVNSTATSWDNLQMALENQLKVRPPKWTVYVEAESNIPWADAVTVVETAKRLHAKVVLLDLESPHCEARALDYLQGGPGGRH
jgi:biopolymer transport protein ExbD